MLESSSFSAVSRVAFVPIGVEEQQSSSFSSSTNVTVDSGTAGKAAQLEPTSSDELHKSLAANLPNAAAAATPASILVTPAATRQQRDSFCDFFDAPRQRGGKDRMSTRLTVANRRDSFDWDLLQPKSVGGDEPRQSICQTGYGLSPLNSANSSTAESLQRK